MDEYIIYLDNAATSFPKPEEVMKAVDHTLRVAGGNPGRSGHRMALAANRIILESRDQVATILGVKDSSRIIFTSGATESLNLAIKGLVKPGDHVITSSVEHSSVTRPLHALVKRGVEVTKIGFCGKGTIDPVEVKKAVKPNTTMIALTHASNVTGAIEPAKDIGTIAKECNIAFLLDASQTAGLIPFSVEDIHADLLAASGHKDLMGPQGTGLLYIAPDIKLSPLKEGGTGGGPPVDEQPEALPDRYEAGTLNTPGIAGLGASVSYILDRKLENIRAKSISLIHRLIEGLHTIDGITIYGPQDANHRVSLVCFNIKGMDPAMVSFRLDEEYGIMSRSGLHCAPDAHRAINTFPAGAVRLSPGWFNTADDIDRAVDALREIAVSI